MTKALLTFIRKTEMYYISSLLGLYSMVKTENHLRGQNLQTLTDIFAGNQFDSIKQNLLFHSVYKRSD
jgi:hypothetical protein